MVNRAHTFDAKACRTTSNTNDFLIVRGTSKSNLKADLVLMISEHTDQKLHFDLVECVSKSTLLRKRRDTNCLPSQPRVDPSCEPTIPSPPLSTSVPALPDISARHPRTARLLQHSVANR